MNICECVCVGTVGECACGCVCKENGTNKVRRDYYICKADGLETQFCTLQNIKKYSNQNIYDGNVSEVAYPFLPPSRTMHTQFHELLPPQRPDQIFVFQDVPINCKRL